MGIGIAVEISIKISSKTPARNFAILFLPFFQFVKIINHDLYCFQQILLMHTVKGIWKPFLRDNQLHFS